MLHLLQNRYGSCRRAQSSHGLLTIAVFALLLVSRSSPTHAAELGSTNAAAILQGFIDRQELAGAVAVVSGPGGLLSVNSVGFSDVEAQIPMAPDALFWIASQSKAMTAVAVLMLVDERKLQLDDPVEKYLPEFRGQMVVAEPSPDRVVLRRPTHPFTIREALSHMTGLPFKSKLEEPTLDGLPLAAAVRSYAMTPLETDPGIHYQYSNAGINTAARVLEVVSGMPYETFMQQRLFDPLGMTNTTFWPTPAQEERVARSYSPGPGGKGLVPVKIGQLLYPLADRSKRFPMPAGGLFSTAQDTAAFCQMLMNHGQYKGRQLLSEAAWKELTRRQTPTSVQESYGFGLAINGDGFGHGGAQSTQMEIRPQERIALIWMVQHAGYPGEGGKAWGTFRDWAIGHFGRTP